jgi:hypothetical protein
MDPKYILNELKKNHDVFKYLLSGISEEEYKWRSEPKKWNLLELVCHLYDEEREDFRTRVEYALCNSSKPAPSIDPEGFVKSRNYNEKNYYEMLENFLSERKNSIEWLNSLDSPKWDNTYKHPHYGPLTAIMFLTNWLAHDLLHFRQIIKIKYLYLAETTKEDMRYAGDW